jgi:predicted nucleic acid-binding protein
MSKSTAITTYKFSITDRLFFDTNIWLYINGLQGAPNNPNSYIYSNALANALQAKSDILTDVLVVSEFINRFARIEHQILVRIGAAPQDFKQFRNSNSFQPIAQTIGDAVRKIIKFATRLESGFSSVDIHTLLTEFENSPNDFNDQILIRLCQVHGLQLVTHDSDFKNRGVDILTSNQRLLTP